MIHEIFPVGPLQCNCSIIGDEATREAMVIDPGDDIEDVLALIRKHKLKVKQIVITHAHIDHVGGAMKLRAATGAPILLNENESRRTFTIEALADAPVGEQWIYVGGDIETRSNLPSVYSAPEAIKLRIVAK